jgi:hypothetical protein
MNIDDEIKFLIDKLNLLPHPEGGYFSEVYKADEFISLNALPKRFRSSRVFSTSIYFLLVKNQISHFHKIQSDEIWHFYKGSSVTIHKIDENGNYSLQKLGNNFLNDELPQIVIKNNTWFAAEIDDKNYYSLVGCTVSPGFEFEDFKLGKREELIDKFPHHKELIVKLTKED